MTTDIQYGLNCDLYIALCRSLHEIVFPKLFLGVRAAYRFESSNTFPNPAEAL
jgi:hypothetical protein